MVIYEIICEPPQFLAKIGNFTIKIVFLDLLTIHSYGIFIHTLKDTLQQVKKHMSIEYMI